jgi:formylmethanofuran dehydrogenase subunit E
VNEEKKELEASIRDAVKLHGHLGPFLVIGVRIGTIAKRILNLTGQSENNALQATVKVPMSTPFSCVLDGIQASTKCTIGNQRLKVEDSSQEIAAEFKTKNSKKTLVVSVNPEIVEELESSLSKRTNSRYLAMKIISAQEKRLFRLRQKTTPESDESA